MSGLKTVLIEVTRTHGASNEPQYLIQTTKTDASNRWCGEPKFAGDLRDAERIVAELRAEFREVQDVSVVWPTDK